MSDTIITFRNETIREWLKEQGVDGIYKPYVTPQDVAHRKVYGYLPMWLAAFAESVSEVSMPRLTPPERERFNRGDMTVQELDHYGARIATYQVRALPE